MDRYSKSGPFVVLGMIKTFRMTSRTSTKPGFHHQGGAENENDQIVFPASWRVRKRRLGPTLRVKRMQGRLRPTVACIRELVQGLYDSNL